MTVLRDYGTFTAAVDAVVTRSGRSPFRNEIASQVRQIYRSNQCDGFYSQDRIEESDIGNFLIDGIVPQPLLWSIPYNFRQIEAARVTNRKGARDEILYFQRRPPGTIKRDDVTRLMYYRGGDTIVFSGHRTTDIIGVSYFTYLPPLHDYGAEIADRPWRYDIETEEWIDQRSSFPVGDSRLSAPLIGSTNWLLFDWFELVVRGALSAILNATDDPRGAKVFAEYNNLRTILKRGAGEL